MADWQMETAAVQVDRHRPTGTVEVALEDGEPTFDILTGCAYDAIDRASMPPDVDASMLYHGSLIARSSTSRSALDTLIRSFKVSIFFDVNLRNPWWNRESVYDLLATAREVKMNEDELRQLTSGGPLEDRARELLSHPRIERLYVTRGSRGACAFTSDGEPFEVTPTGRTRVVDTVGAGDAFSAALILGRLRDWPLTMTLERAQEFAAAVVGLRGATTSDPGFYEPFATAWRSP
jgi:fructokinase